MVIVFFADSIAVHVQSVPNSRPTFMYYNFSSSCVEVRPGM